MNVNLAFTPGTEFRKVSGQGAAGTQWPDNIQIPVNTDMFKRIIYMRFSTDPETLAFLIPGRLKFVLNGQIMGQMPLTLSQSQNGGIQFPVGFAEDGLIAWQGSTPIQMNMAPQEFICACDEIIWQQDSATVIPGTHEPIWFLGIKSMHHW